MGKRLRKLKKIRLHHEGTHTLVLVLCSLLVLNGAVYLLLAAGLFFKATLCLSVAVYAVLLNFFPYASSRATPTGWWWLRPTGRWWSWRRWRRTSTSTTAA